MKTSQKRAIWYADRERKLMKLEKLGLMDEYKAFRGNSVNHKIGWFCKKNNIVL